MFEPNSTIGSAISQLQITTRDWIIFVQSPTLEIQEQLPSGKLAGVTWLFLLNCMIVAAIAAFLFPIMIALEIEMSSDMSELFKRPIWQILTFVVIIGPIMEELMFRSWISGRPKLLVLICGLVAWLGGSFALQQLGLTEVSPSGVIAMAAIIAVAVLIGLVRFWKRPVPVWYTRFFPIIFWGQAMLFGFVHVFNYAGGNPIALLPFVLPQLVGGLIWGYAHIRYGWWSNILMHMAYNLLATSGLLYMLLSGAKPL